jgi:hypothetical protein
LDKLEINKDIKHKHDKEWQFIICDPYQIFVENLTMTSINKIMAHYNYIRVKLNWRLMYPRFVITCHLILSYIISWYIYRLGGSRCNFQAVGQLFHQNKWPIKFTWNVLDVWWRGLLPWVPRKLHFHRMIMDDWDGTANIAWNTNISRETKVATKAQFSSTRPIVLSRQITRPIVFKVW